MSSARNSATNAVTPIAKTGKNTTTTASVIPVFKSAETLDINQGSVFVESVLKQGI